MIESRYADMACSVSHTACWLVLALQLYHVSGFASHVETSCFCIQVLPFDRHNTYLVLHKICSLPTALISIASRLRAVMVYVRCFLA